MFKYLAFLWVLTCPPEPSSYGPVHNGYQLGYAKPAYYLLNEKKEVVTPLDHSNFDHSSVIREIKKSTMRDKEMIARVIEMQRDEMARYTEIMNLSQTYTEVALIVLKELGKTLNR